MGDGRDNYLVFDYQEDSVVAGGFVRCRRQVSLLHVTPDSINGIYLPYQSK